MALLPQEEVVEDGEQLQPGGFNTVVLPFADEVREAKAPQTSDGDVKPEGEKEKDSSPNVQRVCLRVARWSLRGRHVSRLPRSMVGG